MVRRNERQGRITWLSRRRGAECHRAEEDRMTGTPIVLIHGHAWAENPTST